MPSCVDVHSIGIVSHVKIFRSHDTAYEEWCLSSSTFRVERSHAETWTEKVHDMVQWGGGLCSCHLTLKTVSNTEILNH